jgi:hypothetical protein
MEELSQLLVWGQGSPHGAKRNAGASSPDAKAPRIALRSSIAQLSRQGIGWSIENFVIQ